MLSECDYIVCTLSSQVSIALELLQIFSEKSIFPFLFCVWLSVLWHVGLCTIHTNMQETQLPLFKTISVSQPNIFKSPVRSLRIFRILRNFTHVLAMPFEVLLLCVFE